jgi:exodeoxyribonuclease VII large subunit
MFPQLEGLTPAGTHGRAGGRASVLTVSQLAREARILIEEHLGWVTVEGELSNFRRPGSGHWYFTLKDDSAQIRCAMFAGRNRLVKLPVKDGLRVRLSGRVSLYEARGDFQLIVDRMEPAGEGALKAAFDALKDKLAAEGLFDDHLKRPLPVHPAHLTIISSSSGAALRDVVHVIERRFPGLEILLIPSAVQGDGAEAQLNRAFELAGRQSTDLVLLTRGGGSLEDLWAFNLESVARAVADCPHPVVSAIGHQTDFTITDFVADVRAPTPSAAAELITPDGKDLLAGVHGLLSRLNRAFSQEVRHLGQRLDYHRSRLVDPATRIAMKMQQTDELAERLTRAWRTDRAGVRTRLEGLEKSLALLSPARLIEGHESAVSRQTERLSATLRRNLGNRRLSLGSSARALAAVSPLNTLTRGYAVLVRDGERATVGSILGVEPGDQFQAWLQDGSLAVEVLGVNTTPPLKLPEQLPEQSPDLDEDSP